VSIKKKVVIRIVLDANIGLSQLILRGNDLSAGHANGAKR
jgi:hypothetical protein